MSLSLSIVLDTRREKMSGKFPVKLRVVQLRVPTDFQTVYDLSIDDYKKFSAPHVNRELQITRDKLQSLEKEANQFASTLRPFTVDAFEEKFVKPHALFKKRKKKNVLSQHVKTAPNGEIDFSEYEEDFPILSEVSNDSNDISVTYKSYIKNLLIEERVGTAFIYQNSYYSLKKFSGDVPFQFITKGYLIRYEKGMTKKGRSIAYVGIQLRALRAMFNDAINIQKIISRDIYPFGKGQYRIPTSRSDIKALLKDDIKILHDYHPTDYLLQKAKAYWFFCFFGNGMNPSDMAYLKFKNIRGEYILFVRNKTKWTTRENPRIISVFINDEIKKIIEEWGNEKGAGEDYIFPVLSNNMTALEEHKAVRKLCKFMSDRMNDLIKEIEFDKKINNKICRKSLATGLKRVGASTEFIQDTMGHMSKNTTEIYLEDYTDDVKKKYSLLISSFDE